MCQAEIETLEALTEKLPFDDIILYRKLANAAIKREEKIKQQTQQKQGERNFLFRNKNVTQLSQLSVVVVCCCVTPSLSRGVVVVQKWKHQT